MISPIMPSVDLSVISIPSGFCFSGNNSLVVYIFLIFSTEIRRHFICLLVHAKMISQESLSQEIFTKTNLFHKVRGYFELRGSGLR